MQTNCQFNFKNLVKAEAGSRAAATSKIERFVIIANGLQPLTIITKDSILDVAAALDPPPKSTQSSGSTLVLIDHQLLKNKRTLTIDKITLKKFILSLYHYIIQG